MDQYNEASANQQIMFQQQLIEQQNIIQRQHQQIQLLEQKLSQNQHLQRCQPMEQSTPVSQTLSNNTSESQLNTASGVTNSKDKNNSWQKVTYRNTKRKIIDDQDRRVRAREDNSSFNVVTTNIFELLSRQENVEVTSQPTDLITQHKPPPIFIPGVGDITGMKNIIQEVLKTEDYTYKLLNNQQCKIMPATSDAFRTVVKHLKNKNIMFHTYQMKEDRAFRVVLKYIHPSTDVAMLQEEIENLGHKVRQIYNAKHRVTKAPLSIFFVDLEQANNNKSIYEINRLNNCIVSFEPVRKKKEIVQCKNCLTYGHTKSYCTKQKRCMRCGEGHGIEDCDKAKDSMPMCDDCERRHRPTYKGCIIYQTLKKKRFPEPQKILQSKNPNVVPSEKDFPQTFPQENTVQPSTSNQQSYARTLSNKQPPAESELEKIVQESFRKFENLLSKQAEQISTLINLMSKLLSK